MANTTIPSELIADGAITSAKLDTNIAVGGTLTVTGDANFDSNTLFVDASANAVGIGTSSPSVNTEIRGSASNGQLRLGGSTTATYANIYSDNDGVLILGADAGNNAASSYFGVEVDGTERMRIDSSGQLLLGTTTSDSSLSVDIQNTSASSNNTLVRIKNTIGSEDAGLIIDGNNSGQHEYRIGVNTVANTSDLTFSGGTGYRFYTGSTERLRIQAGGGISFNGDTAAANALDDYEEGTWTPVFSNAGTPSYTTQYGRYTKVGRIVYCSIAIGANSVSSASTIGLDGLPFASPDHGDAGQRSCFIVANSGHLSSLSEATARFRINGSSMQGVKGNATTTYMTASEMTSSGTIAFAGAFLYYT
jgi:hypothetical protein